MCQIWTCNLFSVRNYSKKEVFCLWHYRGRHVTRLTSIFFYKYLHIIRYLPWKFHENWLNSFRVIALLVCACALRYTFLIQCWIFLKYIWTWLKSMHATMAFKRHLHLQNCTLKSHTVYTSGFSYRTSAIVWWKNVSHEQNKYLYSNCIIQQ